jgi:hypothetical protein
MVAVVAGVLVGLETLAAYQGGKTMVDRAMAVMCKRLCAIVVFLSLVACASQGPMRYDHLFDGGRDDGTEFVDYVFYV